MPFAALDALERLRLGMGMGMARDPDAAVLPLEADDRAAAAGAGLEVVDPEGVPLARWTADQVDEDGAVGVPEWLGSTAPRPFERLYLSPAEARSRAGQDALGVVVDRLPDAQDLEEVRRRADGLRVVLLVLAGPTHSPYGHGERLVRRSLELADGLLGAQVVAVPLSPAEAAADPDLLEQVETAYLGGRAHRLPERRASPAETGQTGSGGVVLFLTGLSGSGKSTVARAVRAAVLELDGRPVSLLDGDVVRRHLSAGLTFSPEDRDTNIRRIGWVAAEVAHHGGMAVCSPIAPYDATRRDVAEMVRERGGDFVLVHVSTPLEECARRDRKGLYARAMAGEIADFTGVSAPYEEPADADLVLDTTDLTVEKARDRVLDLLRERGHC
ncbi:hypothetical protein GCM10011509_19520 [Ornithinimicrobium pekingense]|uniref:Adenylyl-sulfate kinase n=2 Tax=Ornithinimicrobium pekingense TaxID=384677 RepID=A0ABQ2F8I0_9MICO|nr:hypothetical protein GCM10011509_19520 [Ornithinimicrobium pekingense]